MSSASSLPPPIPGAQPGRRRRASALTRLLGHMTMQAGDPRPAWIVGELTLERPVTPSELRRVMLPRVGAIPRFRSKLVVGRRGGYFQEVELDPGYHFEVAFLGERATRGQIEEVVAAQNAWKFDPNKPLWKFVHIPETEEGGSVIISVINHAIGDGVALVHVLLTKFCDTAKDETTKTGAVHQGKRAHGPKVGFMRKVGMKLYGTYEAGTMTMWRHDKGNPLVCTKTSPKKIVASCPDTLPLDKVKQIAKSLGNGATVNDVLLAVFTRMLQLYFKDVGALDAATGKVRVRAQFPINVRRKGEGRENADGDPNNRFAFGLFTLPLKCTTAKDMITDVKRQVDLIKVSPSGPMQFKQVAAYVAVLPRKLLIDTLLGSANIATVNISNVPGPQAQLEMGGVPIKRIAFYLFSGVGFYVGMFSNAGQVSVSLNMDASIGVDPKDIARWWIPAFESVCAEKRDRATLKETKPHSSEKRGTLSKMTQRTLGGGNMKAAVALPEGEDINDWIAANTLDFFNELTLLYGIVASEAQAKYTKAGEGFPTGFEYRWSDGPDSKPIRVSAPEYVDYVFSWIESQVDDPKIFPVNESEPFPPDFINHYAKDIFKRMFRCFAIIYHRHVDKITAENAAAHLNTCFKHFMYFCFTYKLLDEAELKVMQSLVDRLREEYEKA